MTDLPAGAAHFVDRSVVPAAHNAVLFWATPSAAHWPRPWSGQSQRAA